MRVSVIFCAGLLWLSGLLAGIAQAEQPPPKPPQVPVQAYILVDFYSNQVIAEQNSDEPVEPASITKLMTGYVIYRSLAAGDISMEDRVTVSEKAWRTIGSRMFIEVGSQVTIEDLLMGMVVQSGNDATVALAEYIAGSEDTFAALMNQYAAELGMSNSHFVNASGLPDPEHYMSARDIATLVRAIIAEYPEHYARYSVREYTHNDITQYNRNRLLWQDESVDGVKTGHTESAGFCLVASALRGEMRLISVVLGASNEKDRFSASQSLLNYGFRFFETHKLYAADTPLTEARIWKGEVNRAPLGLLEALYVTIPRGRYEALNAALQVDTPLIAPTPRGTPSGSVIVTLDDQTLIDKPLVVLQDIDEAGWFWRLLDQLILMIYSLFE